MIVEAAAKLFAKSGFSHTTIGDIAVELNVTKPTIYHYFENKDAVLAGVIAEADRCAAKRLKSALTHEGSGAATLKRVFMEYGEYCGSDFGRCQLKLDYQTMSPGTRKFAADKAAEMLLIMSENVNDAIADGSLKKVDSGFLAFHLIEMAHATALRFDGATSRKLRPALETAWRFIAEGVVAARAGETDAES